MEDAPARGGVIHVRVTSASSLDSAESAHQKLAVATRHTKARRGRFELDGVGRVSGEGAVASQGHAVEDRSNSGGAGPFDARETNSQPTADDSVGPLLGVEVEGDIVCVEPIPIPSDPHFAQFQRTATGNLPSAGCARSDNSPASTRSRPLGPANWTFDSSASMAAAPPSARRTTDPATRGSTL